MHKSLILAAALAFTTVATAALAAEKSYQVTGAVTEVTDSSITVDKKGEKFQIARGSVDVPAEVKVGSKVTVNYSMTATAITAKDAPAAAKAKK